VSLPPATQIGAVRLRVADHDALSAFYERAIGLVPLSVEDGLAGLGVEGGPPLVELHAAPGAPPRPPRSSGLFHQAILVPSRADLAGALQRLLAAGWRLTGASDHLVSEALYLDDPEGNGIEIYRDRPRDEWVMREGQIEMATLPLDLEELLSEIPAGDAESPGRMPEGTRIGHVHLQVTDLAPAEAFYEGRLGFDVTVRSYPGALFLSAGGYHHHIGVNTWLSAGAPAPPEGALGLEHFEVTVPGRAERELVRDPDGIELVLSGAR
jgi:catechol 2,3-dioxygenase